ncbi:AraC family transcriptional regulator [Amycolatopsis rhizosphaerae]|uniref:AraC family transcriptional regulator n=1 Tax=Amycolatopsis rhizosphaerae TaxID=2053003 RepID=UPI00164394F7|nr:helix-turn-helix domain-containing protein [Amycolatopsis rhizosphaerae]
MTVESGQPVLSVGYATEAGSRSAAPVEVRRFPETAVLDGPVSRQPIRPDFHVVGLITGGQGTHEVDFRPMPLEAGVVFWLRPGQTHQVVDGARIRGVLLLFTGEMLTPGSDVASFAADSARADHWRIDPDDELTRTGLTHLELLLAAGSRGRDAADALRLALGPLVAAAQDAATVPSAGRAVFTRFAAAVEAGYSRRHHVHDFVPMVHASARTIDRAVRRATGMSAKRFLDERLVLEARRQLATTDVTVAALSARLGFGEPTNFVKFYRRMTGLTPGARQ